MSPYLCKRTTTNCIETCKKISKAGGLRLKSRAGQIGYSVAKGLPPLQHFFERNCVARRRNDAEMGPRELITRLRLMQRV